MNYLAASLHWEALHAARYSTFEHARNARARSLALAQKLGHHSDIAFRQYELGEIYRIFGDLETAFGLYAETRTGFEKLNVTLGLAFYQRAQGDIALQEQRYADALPFFQQYKSYAEKDNHQWSRDQARSKVTLTRAHLGEINQGRQEMQAVLAEMNALRWDDLALQAMLTEPVCLLHEGREEATIELASFLQNYHQSWNETKTYAKKIVESAAIGLPNETVQAAVNLLEHSQCGTLSTVWPGKPGGTIPTRRSRRGSHLVLDPQVTGGRGRQAVIGIIACSTPFRTRSPLV